MSSVDFILNIVGLLLWFNWRGARFDPFNRGMPATLTGTLRRAEPLRFKQWFLPIILIALLAIRALFYAQLGPAVAWTPALDLGAVAQWHFQTWGSLLAARSQDRRVGTARS